MNKKAYTVTCNEDQDEWYIVRRASKDGARPRKAMPGTYRSPEDATEAMIQMFEANQ